MPAIVQTVRLSWSRIRQNEEWNKLLAWARRRYDVDFILTSQMMHVDQPGGTVERLSHAVSTLDPFRLAGLSLLVTIGGSLIAALAVMEKAISTEAMHWRCRQSRTSAGSSNDGAGTPEAETCPRKPRPGLFRASTVPGACLTSAEVRSGHGRTAPGQFGAPFSIVPRQRSPAPRAGTPACRD